MVEMTFDKQVGFVSHGLVDLGVSPRLTQRPEGRSATGEEAVEAMDLEEIDQLAGTMGEPGLNVVAAPCWMGDG